MDPNFDRPVFPKFEAPWVEDLPYMLETYRGGPRPIRLCVEKTKILVKFNHRLPGGQNGPKFWFANFPQIWSPLSRAPALHAWNLQRGARPIWLCVENTKNFGQIQPL